VHTTRIVKQTLLTSGRTIAFSAITVFLALAGGLLYHEYFLASQCLAVMIAAVLAAFMANTFMMSAIMWMDEGCQCCCGESCCVGGCGCGASGNALFWCAAPNIGEHAWSMISKRINPGFNQVLVVDTSLSKGAVASEGNSSVSESKGAAEEGKDVEEAVTDKSQYAVVPNTEQPSGLPMAQTPSALPAPVVLSSSEKNKNIDHGFSAQEQAGVFYAVGKFVLRRPVAVLVRKGFEICLCLCAFSPAIFSPFPLSNCIHSDE